MSIRPLLDWLVVELDPLPTETAGGLFLVGSGAERVRTGEVLRVGPGRWTSDGAQRVPVELQPGDRVAFFRENLEHQQGKQLTNVLQSVDERIGMLRASDVLYVGTSEKLGDPAPVPRRSRTISLEELKDEHFPMEFPLSPGAERHPHVVRASADDSTPLPGAPGAVSTGVLRLELVDGEFLLNELDIAFEIPCVIKRAAAKLPGKAPA